MSNNNNAPVATFLDLTTDPADILQVIALPSLPQERPPCDIAIVLDRSGSMMGEKLDNSKEAIKQVIRRLTVKDKLHLITYETNCKTKVVFENGDLALPEILEQQVDAVKKAGSTNLYGGLEVGAKVLQNHRIEESGRLQRIFLFSDGLANIGKTEPAQIKELVLEIKSRGISISSFGIGADFDEDLMKSIAENGSGDYFFIESATNIPKYVEKGLRGLLALVGTEAVLKVRGQNGAILRKIYAHDVITGAKLGDLKQDNLHQVVSVLEVSPTAGEGADVLTWALEFIPEGEKATARRAAIKYTDDDNLLAKKNPAVEVARAISEIGDSDANVIALLDNQKRKEAIALKQADLARLKSLEAIDVTGNIKLLIEKTERQIANMESKKDDNEVRKEAHYNCYTFSHNSTYLY